MPSVPHNCGRTDWTGRLACLLLAWLALPAWAALQPVTDSRHTLGIGKADCAGAPLLNATHGARAVARALELAGFQVDVLQLLAKPPLPPVAEEIRRAEQAYDGSRTGHVDDAESLFQVLTEAALERAKSLNPSDAITAALLRQTQQTLAEQQDGVIDTESTRLAMVRDEHVPGAGGGFEPTLLASSIDDAVARTVRDEFPLNGLIASVDGWQAILNLGRKEGVTVGPAFNVIKRGEPIELNGRILGYKESKFAELAVTEVQDLLSVARISNARSTLEKNHWVMARTQ